MCGHVGIYSSNMCLKHKEALHTLLFLDTFRGKDATGVAAIRHNADTGVLKSTVPGYEFVEGPKLDNHLKLNDFCWIGHNRFGTMGKNVKTNAHPFMIDDEDGACILVGAHNGTLKNKHVLQDHVRFGTDSEALFNNIAVEGLEKTIEKIEGAWALVYYDHVEEELRIIRNKERSLFYAYEEGKKTLLWASEMWMLRVAASRHNIKLDEDKVYTFVEDTLYKFPAPMKMNEEITCSRKGGLVGKTPAFFQGGTWQNGHWTGGRGATGTTNTGRTTTQSQAATEARQAAQAAAQGSHSLVPMTQEEVEELRAAGRQSSTSTSSTSTTQSGTQSQRTGGTLTTKNESSSKSQCGTEQSAGTNVTNIDAAKRYKGYGGMFISKATLEDQLANGCGWCQSEFISITDKFGWLAPGKPVCAKCLEGGHEVDQSNPQIQEQVSTAVH